MMALKIAVPKEIRSKEHRVSLIPPTVSQLVEAGMEVLIEKGAGEKAFFSDEDYENAGATIVSDAEFLLKEAQVVLKVGTLENRGEVHEADIINMGSVVIGFLNPFGNHPLIEHLAQRKVTAFSMVAAILIIALLTNINAVASPAFLNAKLVVVRAPDDSEVAQNSELRATFSSVSAQMLDQNPKLKVAMNGADESYEELKKVPEFFHTIPRDPAFEVQLRTYLKT